MNGERGSSRSRAFLEDLQRRAQESSGERYSFEDWKTRGQQRYFEALSRTMGSDVVEQKKSFATEFIKLVSGQTPPTALEFKPFHVHLTRLSEEIEEAAKRLGFTCQFVPLIGTVPTGAVNARAIYIGHEDYLVLFDSGLFNFAHLMSKVFACTFPLESSDQGGIQFRWFMPDDDVPLESATHFLSVLHAYICLGSPVKAVPFIIEPGRQRLADLLRDSLEMFVLGHEYGHMVANHLSVQKKLRCAIAGIEMEVVLRNWDEELEADAIGASLMLEAMQARGDWDIPSYYSGIEFFFTLIDVTQRFVQVIQTGSVRQQTSESHPPPGMRRARLRQSIEREIKQEDFSVLMNFGASIELIAERLWGKIAPFVAEMRKLSLQPAQPWQ